MVWDEVGVSPAPPVGLKVLRHFVLPLQKGMPQEAKMDLVQNQGIFSDATLLCIWLLKSFFRGTNLKVTEVQFVLTYFAFS